MGKYTQFGCGMSGVPTWMNFDNSRSLWLERFPVFGCLYVGKKSFDGGRVRKRYPPHVLFGDIVAGLPVPPASFDGVYSSHVLEHLSLEGCRTALRNVLKILKPGGVFRLVVPDLKLEVQKYLNNSTNSAAVDFIRATRMGREDEVGRLRLAIQGFFGSHRHLWLWDYESMRYELEVAGFDSIRRASFNDSQDPRFIEVEDPKRFQSALAIECKRCPG